MMRRSVGLRPRFLGGGSSAEMSSNSSSDISVEYRSRITSYFTRSVSFQGIANRKRGKSPGTQLQHSRCRFWKTEQIESVARNRLGIVIGYGALCQDFCPSYLSMR